MQQHTCASRLFALGKQGKARKYLSFACLRGPLTAPVPIAACARLTAGMGIPAVAGIMYSIRDQPNLKLSQKLMHTRVYGQMTVVTMLVTTMMFRETMRRNGGVFVAAKEGEEDIEDEK